MDTNKLTKLGPLAMIVSEILNGGRMEDKRSNKLEIGFKDDFNDEDLGYYTQTFLLFKGSPMRSAWIKGWKQ